MTTLPNPQTGAGRCSAAILGHLHAAHRWLPQSGTAPVRCPGVQPSASSIYEATNATPSGEWTVLRDEVRPAAPDLDNLVDRACRLKLTDAEGAALRRGVAEQAADLERARNERGTYQDAWRSARDRARKRSEERDRACRVAAALENENARLEHEVEKHVTANLEAANRAQQVIDEIRERNHYLEGYKARETDRRKHWHDRAERAEQQLAHVRALHQPDDGDGRCAACNLTAPCPTLRALDGAQQPDTTERCPVCADTRQPHDGCPLGSRRSA